jgi:tetratricopeptide (TPR) repeat protein
MPTDLDELERHAIDLTRQGDFGPDAIRLNSEILEKAPNHEAAWTRLGRCHMEQRQFDEAVSALRAALAINPSNAIATNLLTEVRRRRAMTPTAASRVSTGFSTREFTMLETLPADEARRALAPRIDALFDTINATSTAARIVESRQRQGESGSKLFHANSCYANTSGHIFAFHHGGRWEPQFNLGWFSSPPYEANCFRAGLGFNLSAVAGRDPERTAGHEQILRFFERFQQTIEKSWKRELARWMAASGGFIQYADRPPAREMLPERAVEWLLNCRHAAAQEWVFVGRWLFLDKPDDAKILNERAKLATIVEDTFRTLYPIWLSTYTG